MKQDFDEGKPSFLQPFTLRLFQAASTFEARRMETIKLPLLSKEFCRLLREVPAHGGLARRR
jgi:hypothetical protein